MNMKRYAIHSFRQFFYQLGKFPRQEFLSKMVLMVMLVCIQHTSLDAKTLIPVEGNLKFLAVANPGFINVEGNSKGQMPKGQLEWKDGKIYGDLSFELNSLDTDNEYRNQHMKEKYLKTDIFPKAQLKLDPIAISEAELELDKSGEFKGKMSLHGETKPVAGKYEYKGKEKKITAKFTINIFDFNIPAPRNKLVTVGEKVDVDVEIKLRSI